MDNKAALAEAFWRMMAGKFAPSNDMKNKYILDGGALLHLGITWSQNIIYHEICQSYSSFAIISHYGQSSCI